MKIGTANCRSVYDITANKQVLKGGKQVFKGGM
jgi:hypothetical protein